MPRDIIEAARGKWPEILHALAGLSTDQLSDTHQPCPLCGGTDRYRFDDLDGTGSWFCNQCGGRHQSGGAGSGMELLLRRTDWDFATAARRIEAHLGLPPEASPKRRGKPHRIPDIPPPTAHPPALGRAVAQWCYRSRTGEQLYWVQRLDLPATADKPARKLFIHRVWLDNQWHYPRSKGPNADPFSCEWPTPRPLYRLPDVYSRPDAPVLIVEGEKAADAAAALFPNTVIVSWSNGSKAVDLVDWSPLAGRRVTVWPDNDDDGHKAMARIAARLLCLPCTTVRRVQPPADAPTGWDIADATWTPQEAAAFARDNIRDIDPLEELQEPTSQPDFTAAATPPPEPPEPDGPLHSTPHFTFLGFDTDGFYYQPHSTGQVVRLGGGSHSSTNLCRLAQLSYWETVYPGKTGPNWTWAASDLFARQAAVGVYDPARIRGRGAWRDNGRSVLHLGDRLIVDGQEQSVTRRVADSTFLYQRLSSLAGPSADPLSTEEASMIALIADRFHWEVPASGMLLAGWCTLAPICGALDWRPHAWLTAAAGSGKSAILDRFVTPLLGDLALVVAGNTTEPGIRQALRSDALPVVFDEAESNERTDQLRMQAILGLARVASSESRAHTLKGSPEGDTQRFVVRSMFLLSSIATGLKQGADKSRFAQLTLRTPSEIPKAERLAHWEALDRDLDHHVTDEIGRRLQARTVSLIPVIRASIRTFTRVAAERFDSQRLGDQYGTLLAGAWSLLSDQPVTDTQARQLINQNNWEPYRQADEIPDERRCIMRILQHQVRVESERTHTRSIGELVEIALHQQADFHIEASLAQATLGRHGIKAEPSPATVIVSNNAEAIAAILRDTAWATCWPTVLTRLPGATKSGSIYFRGAGANSRGVRVPLSALESIDTPSEA
jgi:putative DNA primase/helicase